MDYDYLIVGGGSAGCVLAARLSHSGRYRVCLIEAGPPDRNPAIHIPFGVVALVRGWFCNWKFWSEPQPQAGGRRLYQPRGKTLGGCSSINAMVCTRGHRWDYDHWAELGCEGWAYEDVLPYFRKSETYRAPLNADDARYHGSDGPLNVGLRQSDNPMSQVFIDAAVQAGYPHNDDFNGRTPEGAGHYKVFQKNGRRYSNARAYLGEAAGRGNLTILTDAQVTEVLLRDGRAVGVSVLRGGREQTLNATREVILSAGALQSPQLLMLSGIGPRAELEKHGIPVRHELAGVGENLQDHLDVIIETRARTRLGVSLHPTSWGRLLLSLVQYLFGGRGPLGSNIAEAGGFFKSTADAAIPDLQWHFAPAANVHHGLDLSGLASRYAYVAYVCPLRPHSRGRVGLHSRDPLAPPLIDPRYLSDERDVELTLKGIRLTREVLAQQAFDPHRDAELAPGPQCQSDEDLKRWIRDTAESVYHPVGTCRMGTDAMAVVDPQLRVHGIDGLRVVDASIMPTLVGSNTNAPTTMIAEKAADLILAAAA